MKSVILVTLKMLAHLAITKSCPSAASLLLGAGWTLWLCL